MTLYERIHGAPAITAEPTLDGACIVDREPWAIHGRQDTRTCLRIAAERPTLSPFTRRAMAGQLPAAELVR